MASFNTDEIYEPTIDDKIQYKILEIYIRLNPDCCTEIKSLFIESKEKFSWFKEDETSNGFSI